MFEKALFHIARLLCTHTVVFQIYRMVLIFWMLLFLILGDFNTLRRTLFVILNIPLWSTQFSLLLIVHCHRKYFDFFMAKWNKDFVSTVQFVSLCTPLQINKIVNICFSSTISDNMTLKSCFTKTASVTLTIFTPMCRVFEVRILFFLFCKIWVGRCFKLFTRTEAGYEVSLTCILTLLRNLLAWDTVIIN